MQSCAVRCWRCCFKHDGLITWAYTYLNKQLIGPQFIELTNGEAICTMLTADHKGRTTCLIYQNRPKLCRESLCKLKLQQ